MENEKYLSIGESYLQMDEKGVTQFIDDISNEK